MLKSEGIEADLLLFKEEFDHFQPEKDTFFDLPQSIYKTELSVLPGGFVNNSKKYIRSIFDGYDMIIGCGLTPAYLNRINRST